MSPKLTADQVRQVEEIEDFQRTADRLKHLVTELEANRAGQTWFVEGILASELQNLLDAIRIHEVESYEWVYLPPEMRKSLIEERAAKVGSTMEQLGRLMNVWVSQ